MRIIRTAAIVLLILAPALALGQGVNPDAVREETARQRQYDHNIQRLLKGDPPPESNSPSGLSEAFKSYSTMRLLAWRMSGSGNLMMMGQFNSAEHCARARKMLGRQVTRLNWGRVECIEYMLP